MIVEGFSPECDHPPRVGGACHRCAMEQYQARCEQLEDALRLIDKFGCENYTEGRCSDPDSGKWRDAQYGADAWCAACIAADALDPSGRTGP